YAKKINPNFIIIPQNGSELAFEETDMDSGIRQSYIDAIDGIGIEELFYNSDGNKEIDDERLETLRELKKHVDKIMVADYVKNDSGRLDSIKLNKDEGFISFQREKDNYDYKEIPSINTGSNSNAVNSLADAKNYLYLINSEEYNNKEDFLSAIEATDYDLILIDLYFGDVPFNKADIERLQKKPGGAKRLVISYINIGAAEEFRYYWQDKWKKGSPSWIKKDYEGYDDEYWVEYWSGAWQKIIYGNNDSYIKKIIDAGFDGAYLDNVEAYYFLVYDD
ncbi:MAG: endo alpha-1,4 polygalactosaminidase, partial [Treponema sp.]|nr:endo alpha-1,4 polygalactosaminidase [Treponema sp.]